ncbi:MAG TPA: 30S ribosomal protein S4 [Defluviitaleaceae bacterium]|jgi:small subunit ribosomal protein S4|nr:30S ribosomal protein S4 [Candidatus Epulonipiscium sp.]HOQ16308.1 30S ribosomal protein S4 [Defluviitaleaceae bacterium]HPT75537.1 30S ribosomal protein S4 [Defluviitaleaceae bacterium]HQD50453.1 30S ribosomal protein S4 [Defluviitaleaceae bacterium]
MARYIGPVCRLCRREGQKLYLKGEKCFSQKCPVVRRPYAPGQHGQVNKKLSEYGLQLREKQKAKRIYGILETQFANYFEEADRIPGITGENLLRILEMRLDNVVYRLGLGRSRTEARQVVRHNHILVNGKKVNIPSYQVKVGDVIEVKEKSKGLQRFKDITDTTASRIVPEWLEADMDNLKGKVVALPERDQIDIDIQETLIVELYSK